MEFWLKTCLLLCSFGFFKEFRPSESLLTEYLLGPYHNLTQNEVYYEVYPVWTYAYLVQLVIAFLVTDYLRYKPVIIFEALGYIGTWCLLLWARGVRWMQFMEFMYGIATSTEVAYYTYMYAQVHKENYQKVTSYTRFAILFGKFMSAFMCQILFSTGLMDYHSLNYLSLSSVSVALCIACLLPPAKNSIYFHPKEAIEAPRNIEYGHQNETSQDTQPISTKHKFLQIGGLLWQDFKSAYTNTYLVKWSIWWSFATCINFQVGNYIQPLYESISPFQESEMVYNGAVDAASTLLGACFALGIAHLHLNWKLFGEITMAIISFMDAVLLIFMGLTDEIWIGYVNCVLFRSSYQALITIASCQVAKELRGESYGLVFGLNMFAALLLQTILTIIVEEYLELEPGLQFVIYGGYFGVLSLFFFITSTLQFFSLGLEGIRIQTFWIKDEVESRQLPPSGSSENV